MGSFESRFELRCAPTDRIEPGSITRRCILRTDSRRRDEDDQRERDDDGDSSERIARPSHQKPPFTSASLILLASAAKVLSGNSATSWSNFTRASLLRSMR